MVYSLYKKERILHFYSQGLKPPTIMTELAAEGIIVSRRGIYKFLKKFEATGCLLRSPGSGRPTKITNSVKRFVEDRMKMDDETTVHQLHAMLVKEGL